MPIFDLSYKAYKTEIDRLTRNIYVGEYTSKISDIIVRTFKEKCALMSEELYPKESIIKRVLSKLGIK